MAANNAIAVAVETFVHGYCLVRSETHPYLCAAAAGLYRLHDALRANPARYRKEEWIAWNQPPAFVDEQARTQSRGWYFICALQTPADLGGELRGAYRELGYRLLATHPFFVHTLRRIPRAVDSPATIERVESTAQAQQLARAARARAIPAAYFAADSPVRQYLARVEGQVVGWARSVIAPRGSWCTNVYVVPALRRRGVARSLLLHMLRDDRRHAAGTAVLVSSQQGAGLYPTVGYQQIGLQWIFAPSRTRR